MVSKKVFLLRNALIACLKLIVDNYNYNKSDVFVLILGSSKAFDRVRYCSKLFNELLDWDISPVVLRILIYMYMNQILRVQWCQTLTSSFKVCNGVKQSGDLSPMLFSVYVDSLLGRLEQSGVGYDIGGHFVGALAYADDVTLVGPSRSGIHTLINVCEQFARDYDITFNGTKHQLMFFKGRFSNVSACGFHVNGQYVEVSKCAMHLGHSISSGDRTEIVKYAKISFWSSFNIFRADFGPLNVLLLPG